MSEAGEVISQKTKDYAMKIEAEILDAWGEISGRRQWTVGLGALDIKQKELWRVRGFESDTAYREFLNVKRSSWMNWRRLADLIGKPLMEKKGWSRKRLDRLTMANAEQLTRLDERRRFNDAWLEKALTMTEAKFEMEVDHVVLNDTEPETVTSESMGFIKIPVTGSQKSVIMAEFREIAAEHGIEVDDLGGILEAGMADWHNWHQTEVEEREAAEAVGA